MTQFKLLRSFLLCAFCTCSALSALAQIPARQQQPAASDPPPANTASSETKSDLDEIRRQLHEQQEELQRLRATIKNQSLVIDELRQHVEQESQRSSPLTVDGVGEKQ